MRFADRSQIHSPYTHYAKLAPPARFDLTSSAVQPVTLGELGVSFKASSKANVDANFDELSLSGPEPYGLPELIELLAHRAELPVESVVLSTGTSLANHVALTALFDPGDEVVIEHPTYDPLLHTARLLGANVRRLPRRPENKLAIDPDDLRKAITPRTRLVVLCNLHNPTGAYLSHEELRAVGEAAQSVGANVLVDEVYREAVWGEASRHALSRGENFVVTSSLTKAYGLGGLRCGWILAAPALAHRIRLLQDVFTGNAPHIAEQLSAIALRALPRLEARARGILDCNRALAVKLFESERFGSQGAIQLDLPQHGTIFAPRLLTGSSDEFCRVLRERYEVAVVPGSCFEMPEYFRVGIGSPPQLFQLAIERLAEAIQELSCA